MSRCLFSSVLNGRWLCRCGLFVPILLFGPQHLSGFILVAPTVYAAWMPLFSSLPCAVFTLLGHLILVGGSDTRCFAAHKPLSIVNGLAGGTPCVVFAALEPSLIGLAHSVLIAEMLALCRLVPSEIDWAF